MFEDGLAGLAVWHPLALALAPPQSHQYGHSLEWQRDITFLPRRPLGLVLWTGVWHVQCYGAEARDCSQRFGLIADVHRASGSWIKQAECPASLI